MMPQPALAEQIQLRPALTRTASSFLHCSARTSPRLSLLRSVRSPYAHSMTTDLSAPWGQAPSQQRSIRAHQAPPLWVAAGSELRSLDGRVRLQALDALGNPPLHLSPGQGWRAPCDGWVSLQAPDGQARVQIQPPPTGQPEAQKSRPRLEGLGRLGWRRLVRWIRPGRLSA